MQSSDHDIQKAYAQIDKKGDILKLINDVVDWGQFAPMLAEVSQKGVGIDFLRSKFDVTMMFRVFLLQTLYNMSDDIAEGIIFDRLSFRRFVGLSLTDAVPDAKAIWMFRKNLADLGLDKPLLDLFESILADSGIRINKGHVAHAFFAKTDAKKKIEKGDSENMQDSSH